MDLRDGYMRPVVDDSRRSGGKVTDAADAAVFGRVCPGVAARAQRHQGAVWDADFGPILGIWAAHAGDSSLRYTASSGGALTALATWMLESGHAARVVGARMDAGAATRTESVQVQTSDDVWNLAGSRYAPVANAAVPQALAADTVFIGKPCEAQAVRSLGQERGGTPVILSFFCAGTPRQDATTTALHELGVQEEDVVNLRYRGHGWPGEFTAQTRDGAEVSMSYTDSWGRILGPTVQWRCRLCPDGVGEYSDITAADFWHATPDGYPDFEDAAGISALIARTPRGLQIVEAAARDGAIVLEEMQVDALRAVQPYQRSRRDYLLPRNMATRALGLATPRVRGYRAGRRAVRHPREAWRQFLGSMHRLRHKFGVDYPWRR